MSQKLGRKAVLMYVSAPYIASWLVIAYARDIELIYAGRILSGFFSGISLVAVPAYLVEISTADIRGFLTAGFQAAFALGIFLVIAAGIFLRWSWLAVTGAALVAAGACLLTAVPESPPWLVRASRHEEALRALQFLRRRPGEAVRELRELSRARDPRGGLTLADLSEPQLYKPAAISVALTFFQQFVGINALMAYSVELFQGSSTLLDPTVAAALVALVQVGGTFASSLLMDRAGRRVLYVTSGVSAALCLAASGAYARFGPSPDHAHWNWVPLACFATYIAGFSLGLGPIPFVVAPEMVPTRSRSLVLTAANLAGNFFCFLVTKSFDPLRGAAGLYGAYWTYAGFACLAALFYWAFVPETKGRSLRDIHRSFSRSYRKESVSGEDSKH